MRSDANAPTTGLMQNAYVKWGFIVYSDKKYTAQDSYLKTGDILVKAYSHTVMAITDGANAVTTTPVTSVPVKMPAAISSNTWNMKKTAKDAATKRDNTFAGDYVTTSALNIRHGAGTNKEVLVVIPKGTKVKNFGYYNMFNNTP